MVFKLVTGKKPVEEKPLATLTTRGLILIPKSIVDTHLPKADLVAIYYEKATKRVGVKATKDKSIGRKVGLNPKTNVCSVNAQILFEEGIRIDKPVKSPVTFNKRFGGIIFSISEQVKPRKKPGPKPKKGKPGPKPKKGKPGRPPKKQQTKPPKKAE